MSVQVGAEVGRLEDVIAAAPVKSVDDGVGSAAGAVGRIDGEAVAALGRAAAGEVDARSRSRCRAPAARSG